MTITKDEHGRPTHCYNYAGKLVRIAYPPGKTICVSGYAVMIARPSGTFAVVYGLDLRRGLNHDEAASMFGQCILHQAACDGLIFDEPEPANEA